MALETWILLGWAFVLIWVPFVILTNRREQPAVLFWLFMVELWERFSYYGMRAFLVLYLTKALVTGGFGLKKELAYGIYAAYGALVYLTPLAGGFLADRILGFRRAIIWGAILMAAGQFTLSMSPGTDFVSQRQYEERAKARESANPEAAKQNAEADKEALEKDIAAGKTAEQGNKILLYAGLALLVIGNGFFKPNISSMIGRFYPQGDPRRDRAFTIFYMGINTGAFIAPLTCGYVAETQGWRYGFLLAGIGMVTGLLIFLYASSRGYLQNYADPPADAPKTVGPLPAMSAVYLGTFLLVPIAAGLIYQNDVVDILLGSIGLAVIIYMLYLSSQYPTAERQRIWVIVVLLFFTTVFWGFFELAGSAL